MKDSKIILMPVYRLKKYHMGYNKGNKLHYDIEENTYNANYYAQFKRLTLTSFTIGYIEQHPEIFEKLDI